MDKSAKSTPVTIIITIVTALLTSLFAPYAIESLKERQAQRNKDAEKQERIVATQFEIVEKCNVVYWNYRQAADFLISDFADGQPDGTLFRDHLKKFQEASAEANSQLPIQAFRGRMYFGSEDVYQRLLEIPSRIFSGVDHDISIQIAADSIPRPTKSKSKWEHLHQELIDVGGFVQADLNSIFLQIGSRTKP